MGESIASAVLPTVLGGLMGADEPTYQQPSMDQILTPTQKALQGDLTDIGKLGSKWGKEYFNEDRFNKNKQSYNAIMNRLQGNPAMQTIGSATPTTNTGATAPPTAAPNADMETASRYLKPTTGLGGYQEQMKMMTDPATMPIVQQIASGKITPEMIEAYRRQQQMAKDAQLLGGEIIWQHN